jgi:DNA-directed RNA polymerase subunit RPC12/RpoP
MIHYTCDRCKREIDPLHQTRYVVEIEIHAVLYNGVDEFEDDIDHLTELHQVLAELHDHADQADDDATQSSHRSRYDLCPRCRQHFLRNPLGRDAHLAIGFSSN